MNTYQAYPGESTEPLTASRLRRRSADYTFWIVVLLLAATLQGLFYTQILVAVTSRSLPIFRLTPFNLLPTDLFFIPLAVLFGLLAMMDAKFEKVRSGRGEFLLMWWAICIFGIAVGVYYDNPDLFGDIREFLLRSLLAWAFYFMGTRSNISAAIGRLISLATVIAAVLVVRNFAYLAGIDLNLISIIDEKYIWAEYAILFPYSLLLSRVLLQPSTPRVRIQLAILALGSFSNMWKPNVAAFLICTFLAIVVTRTRKDVYVGATHLRRQIIVTIISAVVFLTGFIMLSGSSNNIANLVLRTYFKQGMTVQDLSGGRFSIARIALEGWRNHPLAGNGFGARLAGDVLNAGLGKYVYWSAVDPHNLALQLLFQIGIVGVTAFLVLLLGWLIRVLKTRREDGNTYRLGLITFMLTVVVSSLYGQFLQSEVAGYLFWASTGLEAAIAATTGEKARVGQSANSH